MPDAARLPFPLRALAVGLRPVPVESWLEPVDDAELAERRATFDSHPAAVVALAGSEEAQAELAALVGACGATIEAAARQVGEDMCLLDGGDLRLVAAAVAFPNRWRPADKLGKMPLAVHGPVPGYEASGLGEAVSRVLRGLRSGRVVERHNWAVLDDPTLHQPDAAAGMPVTFDSTALWLRVERQTLRRLGATGAVCFTIRTRQWPLATLAEHPDQAAGLAAAVRESPDDLLTYKGVLAIRDELLQWLEACH